MNFLKQNSDYALRLMVNLAICHKSRPEAISVKKLSEQEDISQQFAAKILQKLAKEGLVASVMGPKGGYMLRKSPKDISMLDVVAAMQGKITLNHCSPAIDSCPRKNKCPISNYVVLLENDLVKRLSTITLEDMISSFDREVSKI